MAGACPFVCKNWRLLPGSLGHPACGCHLSLGHLARQSWAWLLSTRTAGKGGKGGGEGSEGVGQGVVGSSIKKSRKGNPLVWAWVPSDTHIGETPEDPGLA